MKTVVILTTPGVNSLLSNFWINNLQNDQTEIFGGPYEIKRVYFDLKSKYTNGEMLALSDICNLSQNYEIDINRNLNLKEYELETSVVPNRNLMLVTMAQSAYSADYIIINGVSDSLFCDNNELFFDKYSEELSQSAQKEIKVTSLFWDFEKAELVRMFSEVTSIESTIDLYSKTYSCFENVDKKASVPIYSYHESENYNFIDNTGNVDTWGCLNCVACYKKNLAFAQAGLYFPFFNDRIIRAYQDSVSSTNCPVTYRANIKYQKFLRKLKENAK